MNLASSEARKINTFATSRATATRSSGYIGSLLDLCYKTPKQNLLFILNSLICTLNYFNNFQKNNATYKIVALTTIICIYFIYLKQCIYFIHL